MVLLHALRQLPRDLAGQKLRTALTGLGIVWGTAAVSLLLAFGAGFHEQIMVNSAGLGENIVIAFPSLTSIPFQGLGKGRPVRVTEDDVELLRQQARGIGDVSGEYSETVRILVSSRTIPVDVSGVVPVFGRLRNLIPQPGGRFINELDERQRRRVLFLGNELAQDAFGDADPVGRTVMLRGAPFLVVGVLQAKAQDSSYSGRDKDKAFMPASTFRALTGRKFVDLFIFRAREVERTEEVKAEVLRVLAGKYRFDPGDKEALALWDTTEAFRFLGTFMLAFRGFLAVVGSLTLVVGGIGVSNIMNFVVEERTREFGIKLALGARPRTILVQLLLETLLVTIVSGALGLAVAAGVCSVFPVSLHEYVGAPQISVHVAIVTASLLGLIGLLAGLFPARDAARLDPVVAMKL